ncbi:MAG: DUF3784 domain-containing protein [Eubacterium sp.]|nr:DUF3784 domain-containing protein [Eubacterium sp.]
MDKELIIAIVIVFVLAFACAVISIFSFKEKGFLFNNAYIYASKSEIERMDKRPYYRQSAIVFLLLSVMLTILGILIVLQLDKVIPIVVIPFAIITLLYAIISYIKIG